MCINCVFRKTLLTAQLTEIAHLVYSGPMTRRRIAHMFHSVASRAQNPSTLIAPIREITLQDTL